MPSRGPSSFDPAEYARSYGRQWGKQTKPLQSRECETCGRQFSKWNSESRWQPQAPIAVKKFRKCYCRRCFENLKRKHDLSISLKGNKLQWPHWTELC